MIPYVDLHTHRKTQWGQVVSVNNLMLNETTDLPSHPFSAGLHPWHADQLSLETLSARLNECLVSPDLVAIGETGLDKVCKTPMDLQKDVFEFQLKIASENRKPVIIHCVKAWDELIEISSNYKSIKILHGYNGGIQLTERLLKLGFCFSIGKAILNSGSKVFSAVNLIPHTSLFCETDIAEISIIQIYKILCGVLQLQDEDLRKIMFDNYTRIMSAKISN
ncbi:MAG TPA: TatD family hydrolase [Prolixibacteraceae bacterium]